MRLLLKTLNNFFARAEIFVLNMMLLPILIFFWMASVMAISIDCFIDENEDLRDQFVEMVSTHYFMQLKSLENDMDYLCLESPLDKLIHQYGWEFKVVCNESLGVLIQLSGDHYINDQSEKLDIVDLKAQYKEFLLRLYTNSKLTYSVERGVDQVMKNQPIKSEHLDQVDTLFKLLPDSLGFYDLPQELRDSVKELHDMRQRVRYGMWVIVCLCFGVIAFINRAYPRLTFIELSFVIASPLAIYLIFQNYVDQSVVDEFLVEAINKSPSAKFSLNPINRQPRELIYQGLTQWEVYVDQVRRGMIALCLSAFGVTLLKHLWRKFVLWFMSLIEEKEDEWEDE